MKACCVATILALTSLYTAQADEAKGSDSDVPSRVDSNGKPDYLGTDFFGVTNGQSFTDEIFLSGGGRIATVFLSGCGEHQHLRSMDIDYRYVVPDPVSRKAVGHPLFRYVKAYHGTAEGESVTLDLAEHEYITQVDLTTWQEKLGFLSRTKRTRIGSIKFTTSASQIVKCGASSASDPKTSFNFDGYALSYFTGSAGKSIDGLAATFIKDEKY